MAKLSTLFVRNLIFSGIHGSTGREPNDPQHFQVDIKIQIDITQAAQSDLLSDTYDYKHARDIARSIIEDERHVLIETIATRIVQQICQDPKVFQAEVELIKLNASQNGVPGISVSYKRVPQEMV